MDKEEIRVLVDDFQMEIHSQQVVVRDHLRRRGDCCSSSSSTNEEDDDGVDDEEVNSSSPPNLSPLQSMSSLLLQLPLKRGLSKHYNGKSESYTSLSNVKRLEDLAKQDNPFNKRLKICNSSSLRRNPST